MKLLVGSPVGLIRSGGMPLGQTYAPSGGGPTPPPEPGGDLIANSQETLVETYENTNPNFYFEAGGQSFDPSAATRVALYYSTDPATIQSEIVSGDRLIMFAANNYSLILAIWTVSPAAIGGTFPVNVDVISNDYDGGNITPGGSYSFRIRHAE